MSMYSNGIIKLFSLSALFFVIRLLLCFRWHRLYVLSAGGREIQKIETFWT